MLMKAVVNRLAIPAFFLTAIALGGCGGSKGSKDGISGKVTSGGQAVSGEIVFTFSEARNSVLPSVRMAAMRS